ncbi:MAG: redox-regulated ATPase YchF [Candidatus Delongbacteria bacterium]|nr:redox-regulated ATPase YchF [Candidatus Delongbacteria bacterium]
MGLNCGIIGLVNCGKTTFFNCMSSTKAEATNYAFATNKSNIGVIKVPDPRLPELTKLQPTKKEVPATVEIVDVPGLTKGSSRGQGVGNAFLNDIKSSDALIHVLRCFDDENLPHVDDSVDPVRDWETVNFELQVKDMETVERKIGRMEKLVKTGDKDAKKDIEILNLYKQHLDDLQPARTAPVSKEDARVIDDLFLYSAKPVMVVCNVDDEHASEDNEYVKQVREALKDENIKILRIAAGIESEITELDNENERHEFLNDYGLDEPSVDVLIREAYDMLNLQSFFTIGEEENRAWTIRKGMTAPEAAGVIHSDLQKGFIRAEVMKYEDFVKYKSEQAVKEAGKFYVEGKNYVVQDGDILHIRFNI